MRKSIIIVTIIILVAGLAAGIWFWQKNKKQKYPVIYEPSAPAVSVGEPKTIEFRPHPNPDDKDLDGLSNEKEKELGTSEYEFDTDGDGLSDTDEINYWKSDPLKTDTDGDGFADGWEVIEGYNPAGAGKLTATD